MTLTLNHSDPSDVPDGEPIRLFDTGVGRVIVSKCPSDSRPDAYHVTLVIDGHARSTHCESAFEANCVFEGASVALTMMDEARARARETLRQITEALLHDGRSDKPKGN